MNFMFLALALCDKAEEDFFSMEDFLEKNTSKKAKPKKEKPLFKSIEDCFNSMNEEQVDIFHKIHDNKIEESEREAFLRKACAYVLSADQVIYLNSREYESSELADIFNKWYELRKSTKAKHKTTKIKSFENLPNDLKTKS